MEGGNAGDSSLDGKRASDITLEQMVQVPETLLTSLMTTVEQLKQTVDQIQRDNVAISSELQALRAKENRLPGFFRFPTLPAEIRQMIVSRILFVSSPLFCN